MSDGNLGSIEKAISGDYEFSIGAVLSEAWAKTSGSKWTIQLAFLYYFLVLIGVVVAMGVASAVLMGVSEGGGADVVIQILMQLGLNLIIMPMAMGIAMIGIKRSVDAQISSGSVFAYFSKMFSLLATMILMYIMIFIGFILLILPGIYLIVAYYMAMPLVVEKGLSPWQALETSRKAITKRWFSVFGFFIVTAIIVMISAIPLGIGLIWTLPMTIIAFGILYRNMFGVEAETIA